MTSRDFLFNLPANVSPAALEGLETRFHFDLGGGNGGQYTIEVAKGRVVVTDGLTGDAKCVVRASGDDFIALATGELNPMMAVLTGKVKMSNQGEMLKYAKIFGLM